MELVPTYSVFVRNPSATVAAGKKQKKWGCPLFSVARSPADCSDHSIAHGPKFAKAILTRSRAKNLTQSEEPHAKIAKYAKAAKKKPQNTQITRILHFFFAFFASFANFA